MLNQNDELLDLLHANLQRVEHNRYTVEVMLSVAQLCRQNLLFIQGLDRMNSLLESAEGAIKERQPQAALNHLDSVLDTAERLRQERNRALAELSDTWYKTWFPRVPEANGRRFRHELDDVKDHRADRTIDLSYHILRQMILPFGEWVEKVRTVRNRFARDNKLPARDGRFDWADTKTLSSR